MKRILSGIKPSGEITLGNYLGAMKRWVELQQQEEAEFFYFVPNLHALTVRQDAKTLAINTLSDAAWLLAMGVDWRRSTLYVQSQVPAHSELTWILNNYVTMGELRRMTQFKDKSAKQGPEGQLAGLFGYPVLMAADILLYDADEVPVGEDQVQHVELARDIAKRFNELHGPVFKLPRATVQDSGARIMNLQDPAQKMSKSDQDQGGVVMLTDSLRVIEAKFKRAVTDSGDQIKASPSKPALSNLLTIFSLLSDEPVAKLERRYEGKGYGEFKADLAAAAVNAIHPLQERLYDLMSDRDRLISILQQGRDKAAAIAEAKLSEVKAKLGLL
ncbi:tryptophan--tRNA ligase [Candidatus Parcubacteria bacterium]|nr:tryptophan--tRNA ligase [Candidatus Parcubacteria bacterium]